METGCRIFAAGFRFCILSERNLTVMLNKPAGYITTLSDEYGRKCVADLVSDYGVRLNPVGRLDKDSEGLLLMTSDGMLLQHLTHPRYSLPKVYIVTLDAKINDSHLERLRAPMEIDGYNIRPVQVEILKNCLFFKVLSKTVI